MASNVGISPTLPIGKKVKKRRERLAKYSPFTKGDSSEIKNCSNKTFFVVLNPNTGLTSEMNVEELGLYVFKMKREIGGKE